MNGKVIYRAPWPGLSMYLDSKDLSFFKMSDENGVTLLARKFSVKDSNGKIVFAAESEETDLASKRINIQSKNSVVKF